MNTRRATVTALMAALVFLGTYIFKIPSPFGGYAHLGDCMIILSVCLLGTGHAVLAAAIGAGLADLLGGYMIWVVPTAVIKGVWALLMGLFMYRLLKNMKFGWLAIVWPVRRPGRGSPAGGTDRLRHCIRQRPVSDF